MKFIDDFLHSITMYRLLLYGLVCLGATAFALSLAGVLPVMPLSLVVSAAVLVTVCIVTNLLFAKLFGATTNSESALITALILFCIFLPPQTLMQGVVLALVGVLAMASKYVLAVHKMHIFNPAAIAAVAIGLTGLGYAGWWIATGVLLPFTTILALLILRKIHRFTMFFAFLVIALTVVFITTNGVSRGLLTFLSDSFVALPLVFFGSVMLAEPATTPPTKRQQMIYGALVGALLGSGLHAGVFYMTPEMALVLGNLYSYTTNLRRRITLRLAKKEEIAPSTYRFEFEPDAPITHKAGQYLELTLPLAAADDRGNRRFFTIASSPTEDNIQFGIKMNTPPSAFKKVLNELKEGGEVYTNRLAGDFVLPRDPKTKVAFIAGGIGITPYRSMLKELIDTNSSRDIVLFYQVAAQQQIAYRDILDAAKNHGLKPVFVITDKVPADLTGGEFEQGFITKDLVTRHAPDFKDSVFYISGPPGMVENYSKLLRSMGVKPWHIKTDYFAGY